MSTNRNLDILRNERLDLVICLTPTSSLYPPLAWNPVERVAAATRRACRAGGSGSEAKKLRSKGAPGVVLIQPTQRGPRCDGGRTSCKAGATATR